MQSNIFLIGYRGTGKTTVGRLLAQRLGWNYIDADPYLEGKAGKSIRQIFSEHGEAHFRGLESQTLRELAGQPNHVLSLGGGVIMRDENRRVLEGGWVVWLTADVDTIADRLATDPTTIERRPNLTTGGIQEIRDLLEEREPLYGACANLTLDTRERSPESLAETILSEWTSSGSKSSG